MIQMPHHRLRPANATQLLIVAGIFVALVFAIIVVCGYVLGWMWTGLPKKALWDWQDLSIVPAVLALGGTSSPGRRSARRGRRPTRDPATLGGLSAGASGYRQELPLAGPLRHV